MRSPCFATLKLFINQRRKKRVRLRPHYIKPWVTKNWKKKKTNKQTNITTIGYNELEF